MVNPTSGGNENRLEREVSSEAIQHTVTAKMKISPVNEDSPSAILSPNLVDESDNPRALNYGGGHRLSNKPPTQSHPNDDDEEDEEMILISESASSMEMHPTSSLRRTPGANSMHRSAYASHKAPTSSTEYNCMALRRTPGPSNFQRRDSTPGRVSISVNTSFEESVPQTLEAEKEAHTQRGGIAESMRNHPTSENEHPNVLGYGLTLTSPVGRGKQPFKDCNPNNTKTPRTKDKAEAFPSSASSVRMSKTRHQDCTPVAMKNENSLPTERRPPLDPNSSISEGRESYLYTPAGVSLAKNRNLNLNTAGNGTFSPNTVQLVTSMDNLLNDKDDVSESNCDNRNSDSTGIKLSSPGKNSNIELPSNKEQSSPVINQASSFGADSHISVLSEDWHDTFTLENKGTFGEAYKENAGNGVKAILGEEAPLRPKPTHNSFHGFTRNSSSDAPSRASSKHRTPDESPARPISLHQRTPGNGAFSPPSKNGNHVSSQTRKDAVASFHAPTPQKAVEAGPYNSTLGEEHIFDKLGDDKQHVSVYYHQYFNMMPIPTHPQIVNSTSPLYDGTQTNASSYDTTIYHHQHTDPNREHLMHHNTHQTHYGQFGPHQLQNYIPHPSVSPVPMSAAISPLTVPAYHPTHMAYSESPIHFQPSHPAPMQWAGPDIQGNLRQNQWGGFSDGINWDQHHMLTSDARFGPNGHAGRHPFMSSPTPPVESPYPMSSWMPSEYADFSNNLCMMHNPASNGSVYNHTNTSSYYQSPHHMPSSHELAKQIVPESGERVKHDSDAMKENIGNARSIVEPQGGNTPQMRGKQGRNRHERAQKKEVKFSPRKPISDELMSKRSNALKSQACHMDIASSFKKKSKKKNASGSISSQQNKDNLVRPNPLSPYRADLKPKSSDPISKEKEMLFELKRAELVETPATRSILKDFQRKFRAQERISLDLAADFARSCLSDEEFPDNIHWRIYLELADLAKRGNKFNDARNLFEKVCELQPCASQGWLEYSKLEEEEGNVAECSRILNKGLTFCSINENLLIRTIKHEERMGHETRGGNLSRARELLAPLKHCNIEKVWKIVLEGAMMEARAGNEVEARRILKYLMHWVPWYGPLYFEAFRLERDSGRQLEALSVVENGLKDNQRYGPLWFGGFRLCEGMDILSNDLTLPRTLAMIKRASISISRELIWKVHFEAAQAQERAAHVSVASDHSLSLNDMLTESRKSFVKTAASSPENLTWKVWLAAGRMELSVGRMEHAKKLFLRSYAVVPGKGRPAVLLECARMEEFLGNLNVARAILCKSRAEVGSDWKVWLQSVCLEVRSGNRQRGIELAREGLEKHSGTGRLWAALIQLRDVSGEDNQLHVLKQALGAVPKSGEVWCEAARMFLNPSSPIFEPKTAAQQLQFATKFTPQFGDSFVETVRLEMLQGSILPLAHNLLENLKREVENDVTKCDAETIFDLLSTSICEVADVFKLSDDSQNKSTSLDIDCLEPGHVDTSGLLLRCANADPNYGKLWFHCRRQPADTARSVLTRAKEEIAHDLSVFKGVYLMAEMRRIIIEMLAKTEFNIKNRRAPPERKMHWESFFISKLYSAPTLHGLLSRRKHQEDMELLESCVSHINFVTGLSALNKQEDLQEKSLVDRRQVLFGSDLLLTSKTGLNT